MFDITRFHKLIRSRTVWIVFLVLIIASFVFNFSPNVDQSAVLESKNRTNMKVNGRMVKSEEYQRNAFYADRSNLKSDKDATARTLERIALLDQAAAAGVRMTAEELQRMIARYFRTPDGAFDPQSYMGYIMQEKWPSEGAFAEFQLQEGTLMKLLELAAGGAQIASPADIREAYERDFSTFEVEYAAMDRSKHATNQVQVTDAMVEAYYNDHKESYRRGEDVKVRYLGVRVDGSAGTNGVTDAEAQAYYNERLATEFTQTVPSTNAVGGVTNTTANLETRTIPFLEARAGIVQKLGAAKAFEQARQRAFQYYDDMLPRRDHTTKTWEQIVAEAKGATSVTTEYFTIQQPVPGIEPGVPFTRAAFALGTNVYDRVSEPVLGSNTVYLVELLDRRPSRIQALTEVKDLVRLAAMEKARNDALLEKAKAARTSIVEAMKAGKSFAESAQAAGLVATNAPAFSRAGGEISKVPGLFQILNQIDEASPGDVLQPIANVEAALLVHLKAVKPADPAGFEEKRKTYLGGLAQRRFMALRQAYVDEISKSVSIDAPPAKTDEKAKAPGASG